MNHDQCLNCEAALQGDYCHHCGQKATTHRLSMKHFVAHDMVHGIWHLDKGIIYTVRKAIVSPGKTARDYIAGKRTGHYNIVTLILLLFGVLFYLLHQLSANHLVFEITDKHGIVKSYPYANAFKAIIFSFVPIFAWVAKLFFRKTNYNYTEHIVAATFTLVGVLILLVVVSLLDWTIADYFFTRSHLEWALYGLFICFAYYQLVGDLYSKLGFTWRILSVMTGFVFVWLVLFGIIYSVLGYQAVNFRYS